MLLRSLIVNSISSHPSLLTPALSVLSALCKPGRSWLFNVDKNPLLHTLLKIIFYSQFCAGETHTEIRTTVQKLKDLGLRGVILTYAKETVFDSRTKTEGSHGFVDETQTATEYCVKINSWQKATLQTIDLLDKGDYLALKLSGAGPHVTNAFAAGNLPSDQMLSALDEVCQRCKAKNVGILVDAESQHFQRGIARVTLDLMRKYNHGGDGSALVYNTYQADLKSMPETLYAHLADAHEEGFTLGLKLVRGAYLASDERSLFHDTKEETDKAFDTIAQGALRKELLGFGSGKESGKPFPSVNLFLASHNKASLLAARQLQQQRVSDNEPTVPVGFAQLHGMADKVSFSLLQLKHAREKSADVYKYSTWGSMSECLGYMCRRAIENRDAAGRTQDEYVALKGEVRKRVKLLFGF